MRHICAVWFQMSFVIKCKDNVLTIQEQTNIPDSTQQMFDSVFLLSRYTALSKRSLKGQ